MEKHVSYAQREVEGRAAFSASHSNAMLGELLHLVLRPGLQRLADPQTIWRRLQAECRLNLATVEAVIMFKLVHHFFIFTKHWHENAHKFEHPTRCHLQLVGLRCYLPKTATA